MGHQPGSRPRPLTISNTRDKRGRMLPEVLPGVVGVGISSGIGTIYKTSVKRTGDIIETYILMDFTGLSSSTTDLDIIGRTGAAHIGQITTAVNGIILGGKVECYEAPVGGVTDIDLYAAVEATGVFDAAISGLTETAALTAGGAWSLGTSRPIIADSIAATRFLYWTSGAAGTAADYTAGRFLITLIGHQV